MRKFIFCLIPALFVVLCATVIISVLPTAQASSGLSQPYDEPVAQYLETEWRREVPFTLTALNATTWTDLTPSTNLGATFLSENDNIIITVATSTTVADTNFTNGLYWILTAGTSRTIPTKQKQSGYYFYAKCSGADILSDTLDNAAAVDKSTTPATVGIPITGHSFVAGDYVTIAGSTNYNGTYRIVSKSANEIVIYHAFTAETFAGTETAVVNPTVFSTLGGS